MARGAESDELWYNALTQVVAIDLSERVMKSLPRILAAALVLLALSCVAGYPANNEDAKSIIQGAPLASQYPNAGYVNLVDEARQVIKPDGSWTTTTHITARIFNQRGRDKANVHLPYNAAFETIKILKARTIQTDGTVINVPAESIRDISEFSGFAMYSSVKSKVMIMPAIEDDCIIDYEWQISGRNRIMPNQFWTIWYLQSQAPTMLSRYTLEVPASRVFKHLSNNTQIKPKVVTSLDGKTVTYTWEGRDYPEVEPEPYMPPLTDICPWFELSSVASWNEIAAWYWKLVEPQMKLSPEIQQAVDELTKDKKTQADKAKAIFYWVEDRIRYVGLEFGTGAYEPHSARDVFQNRYGDCKDQATLLVTMLRAAGIKAYPVLVPTKLKGMTSQRLPSPGVFDHAIGVAEIDGVRIWLDTTAEVCPFGGLPQSDRGREVLVIKDGAGEFVKTPDYSADENMTYQSANIKLNADGGITASVLWTSSGSTDLSARGTYKYAKPSQIKEGFEGSVAAISPDAKLTNYSVTDPERRDEPLKLRYEFQSGGWADRTRRFLIFRPSLYQTVLSETPFSKSDRKYEILFHEKSSSISETQIILPDGITVEEIPDNVSLKADFATFDRTYELSGNTLKIMEKLVRQDAKVPVSRYSEVKKFYEDAIHAQKSQVVLRVSE